MRIKITALLAQPTAPLGIHIPSMAKRTLNPPASVRSKAKKQDGAKNQKAFVIRHTRFGQRFGAGTARLKRSTWNRRAVAPLPGAAGLSGELAICNIEGLAPVLSITDFQIPNVGQFGAIWTPLRFPDYYKPVCVGTVNQYPYPVGSDFDSLWMEITHDFGQACVCGGDFEKLVGPERVAGED